MKKRDSDQSGGRGAEETSLIRTGPALPSAPRPENEQDSQDYPDHKEIDNQHGKSSIPAASVAGPFSDSEGGRDSGATPEGGDGNRASGNPSAANPAIHCWDEGGHITSVLYTVAMSYISLIVKLGEMDAMTFREIEKQVMKDGRLSDFERKTCIIPLLDARWRYLARGGSG